MAASTAMIATTINNSASVNPFGFFFMVYSVHETCLYSIFTVYDCVILYVL